MFRLYLIFIFIISWLNYNVIGNHNILIDLLSNRFNLRVYVITCKRSNCVNILVPISYNNIPSLVLLWILSLSSLSFLTCLRFLNCKLKSETTRVCVSIFLT